MNKKYQVFVSSTFQDLKDERKMVIESLLSNKDYIPVGMEYFPATNDDQMAFIKRLIDNCDYYILILGGRYGSIESESGKSYTQLEYEYAEKINIPICGFYIEDKGKLPTEKVDIDPVLINKLQEFEDIIKKRLCKGWNTPEELAINVLTSLYSQIEEYPRPGWVRADEMASEASAEILRLQEENKKLTQQVNFLSSKSPAGTELYKQGEDIFEIHYYLLEPETREEERIYRTISKSWNEIFLAVCTILLQPVHETSIRDRIEDYILSSSNVYSIKEEDFQTILVQLMALKLINTDISKDYGGSAYTYWVLTPYGRSEMVRLKAIKR